MDDEEKFHSEERKFYSELFLGAYLVSAVFIAYTISVVTRFALYAWFNNASVLENFTMEVIWDKTYSSTFFGKSEKLADFIAMLVFVVYFPVSWRVLGVTRRLRDIEYE